MGSPLMPAVKGADMPNPNADAYDDLPDRNRDPGADPESAGIPGIAEDLKPEGVDDPERISVPTEVPVVSTSFGTTAEEQRQGEGLERKLAREEADVQESGARAPEDQAVLPAEEAAVHEQEP
jgi:hypothetical protein